MLSDDPDLSARVMILSAPIPMRKMNANPATVSKNLARTLWSFIAQPPQYRSMRWHAPL
jgi:hypothetical protein